MRCNLSYEWWKVAHWVEIGTNGRQRNGGAYVECLCRLGASRAMHY